ncbi:MAG: 1-deoxy-D-xylulose-5-phosphate reductoisomerase, partial [Bacteroidia bacterium]|nr:1-deoxy-D-xylulose-5-phosphate reductoisomerase [Bacteroidia bacterium]
KPDKSVFRSIEFAYEAMKKGGNLPCILNAANEVAVSLFLQEKISFPGIFDFIESELVRRNWVPSPSLQDLVETDREIRIQFDFSYKN